MENDISMKTIFCDIDGTLIEHFGSHHRQIKTYPILLEKTLEKFDEWDRKGYNVILTTGRRESSREITEKQLESLGIFYDQLIMGIGGFVRVLVNDRKPDGRDTAFCHNVDRNYGIGDLDI